MFGFLKKMATGMVDRNIVHPQSTWWALNIPRSKFDYAAEVGTGLGSNVIMSPVQWIMRTFPEAPVILEKKLEDDTERVYKHKFLDILNKPNRFYNYEIMIMAVLFSWTTAGNAYLIKVRNTTGEVVELWYAPHWMVKPVGSDTDKTVYIKHYEYNPGNIEPIEIPIEDIIHFRFGINPENIREGLSPLGCILREVFTDDEASNYSASILRNMGVPGIVISPADNNSEIQEQKALEIKEKFTQGFTEDNRGMVMVATGSTKVETFGFDPNQLNLTNLRNVSEERVCAALGLPAAVVGFGSGMEQTKVGATMRELIRLAWSGCLMPMQRHFSQALESQLLPDFDDDESLIVAFNNREVSALQEDKNDKIARLNQGVVSGWVKVSEAREAEGLEVNPEDEIYLRALGMVDVGGDEEI